jgi:hypothetical protein
MIRHHALLPLLSALSLAACAMTDDGAPSTTDRDPAVEALQRQTGAPVALQVSEAGYARVLAMTPGFPVPGHATDPATPPTPASSSSPASTPTAPGTFATSR